MVTLRASPTSPHTTSSKDTAMNPAVLVVAVTTFGIGALALI